MGNVIRLGRILDLYCWCCFLLQRRVRIPSQFNLPQASPLLPGSNSGEIEGGVSGSFLRALLAGWLASPFKNVDLKMFSVLPFVQALLLGFDLVRKALCRAHFVSIAYLTGLVRGELRTQPLSEEDPLVVFWIIADVL